MKIVERKQGRTKMKLNLIQIFLLTLFTISDARDFRDSFRKYYEKLYADETSENNVTNAVVPLPLPSITFTSDWKEKVQGELGIGRDFRVNYAASRLQGSVFVEYKFNDGSFYESKSLGEANENGVYKKIISIPVYADKVEMWFKNESNQYDSDYGQNYNFAITRPSIAFLNDWQEKPFGKLVAGRSFDLFYDSRRLKEGAQIEAQMKFLDDTVVGKTLSSSEDSSFQTSEISIPENAEKLVMWFYYEDSDGNKQYDSDYGQNYRFNLSS